MTTNTVSQFLFKVFVTAGLVATLTACGGGGGGAGNDQNTTSSHAAVSSTASSLLTSSTSSSEASSVSNNASSLTSNNSVSSVASTSLSTFLMGGAIQEHPLNIATVVSTLAGAVIGADGIGTAATFSSPNAIVRDGSNLYVADTDNRTIRKIVVATGVVTTFAGTVGVQGSADGTGAAARFMGPQGITTDGTNLYVTDNGSIRKIVIATGVVTTLAGSGGSGITTDGTNLFVTDDYTIRKIVIASGAVTTLAGTAGVSGSADGTGASASFYYPSGITTDDTNLYVADTGNHAIRKIVIATGVVTTLAGSGDNGITTDGTNLYVTDSSTIRKIVISTGVVTTLAGGDYGSADGTGAAASFSLPKGLATDGTNLYVADTSNSTIRKIVIATGTVTTLAGRAGGGGAGSADGTSTAASFYRPDGVTTDGTNLYVVDSWNNTIRQIVIATGAVTTLAGTAGTMGSADGTSATARFFDPAAITTDGTNLYVTDSSNYTIRKIVIATGSVTTLAGTAGVRGSADGTGAAASFSSHYGITTDGTNLYVADSNNYTIRKIVIATGAVTTIAGTAGIRGNADGTGAAAIFYFPEGITTDGTNLYVVDTGNNTIRKIVIATGAVTTLAGTAGVYGSADGTGAAASFAYSYGITTDGTNLYVADSSNQTIRKIVIATGTVTTLAGTPEFSGSADGIGTAARFNHPYGITTDGFDLFVTDTFNHTVRKIH